MSEERQAIAGRLVDLFFELARIPSPTGSERPVVDFILAWLERLGVAAEEGDPVGEGELAAGNIYCRLPGNAPGMPVLFSAHTDTVASPQGSLPEPVLEGGVLKSSSEAVLGADNKAAVAAMLMVMERAVSESTRHAGIELLLTVCEESGLRGAKAADLSGIEAGSGFCMDCTGSVGSIVVRSPSQKTVRASFTGQAAHAGVAPEEGRSAVVAAANAVASMELGRLDEMTTANIGIIAGGDAVNIVPPLCRIEGEARSHDEERLSETVTAMLDAINAAAADTGVDVATEVVDEFKGFDFSEGGPTVELAERAVRRIGLKPDHVTTGGGSDVNELNGMGLPCVNLAIGMEKLHTADEFIAVESLLQAHELLMAILEEALDEE